MSASEVRVSPVAKSALRAKAAAHNAKARPSARVSLPVLAAVYARGVAQPGAGSAMLAQRRALKRVDTYLVNLAANRPCQDSDLYPTRTALTASLADATHLARELNAVEVRALIASAALYSDADPRRVFNLSRALARSARDPQLFELTDALTALVADGNSSMARRLRAMRQLRDRFGRWIEMGGGIRFKVDMPGVGPGFRWLHGVANGMDVPNGLVNVKLEDGRQVKIPAAKVEKIKATLPDPNALRKAAVARKYESKSDAQLQAQWKQLNDTFSRGGEDAPVVKAQMDEIKEALAGRMQTGEADDPNDPAPTIARLDLKHVTPSQEDMATDPVDAEEFRAAAQDSATELKRLVPDNSPNASRRDALIARLNDTDPAETDKESLARLADDAAALHQELLDSSPSDADAFRGFSEDVEGLASLRDVVKAVIPGDDAEVRDRQRVADDLERMNRERSPERRAREQENDRLIMEARAQRDAENPPAPPRGLNPAQQRIANAREAQRRRAAEAEIPAPAALPDGWVEMPVPAAAENFSRIVKADDGIMVGLNKGNGKWFDPRNPWSGFDTPEEAVQARRDADARGNPLADVLPSAEDRAIERADAIEGERQRRQAEVDAARAELPGPVSQEEALKVADEAGVGQAVKEAIATGDRAQIAEALRSDPALGGRFSDWESRADVDLPRPEQREQWAKDSQVFEPLLNAQPATPEAESVDVAEVPGLGRPGIDYRPVTEDMVMRLPRPAQDSAREALYDNIVDLINLRDRDGDNADANVAAAVQDLFEILAGDLTPEKLYDWLDKHGDSLPVDVIRDIDNNRLGLAEEIDGDERQAHIDDIIAEDNADAARGWAAAEQPIEAVVDAFFESDADRQDFIDEAEAMGVEVEFDPNVSPDGVQLVRIRGREDAIREFYDDKFQGGDSFDEIRDDVVVSPDAAAPEPDVAPESAEAPAPSLDLAQWANDYTAVADNLSELSGELRRGGNGTYGVQLGNYARVLKSYGDKLKDPNTSAEELDATYAKIEMIGNRIDKLLIGESGDFNVPETIADAIDEQWLEIENLVNARKGMDNELPDFDMPDVPDEDLPAVEDVPEAPVTPEAPEARQPDALDQIVTEVPAVSVSEFLAGNEFARLDDFGNEAWPIDPNARVIAYGGDDYNLAIVYQNSDGSIEYRGPGGWFNESDQMGEPGNMVPMREQILRDLEQGRLQRVAAAETPQPVQGEPEGPLDRVDAVPVEFDRMVGHRWLLPDGSWVDYDPTDGSMIQYDPETGEGREYFPDIQLPDAAPQAETPAAPALPEINDPKRDLLSFAQAVRGMPEFGEYQERPGHPLDRLLTSLVRDLGDRPTSFWNDDAFGTTPAESMADDLRAWDHLPEIKQIIDALRAGVAGGPVEAREPDVTGQPDGVNIPDPRALDRFDRLSADLNDLANKLADDGFDVADLFDAMNREDPAGVAAALAEVADQAHEADASDVLNAVETMIRRLNGEPAAPVVNDDIPRRHVIDAMGALVGDNGVVEWDLREIQDFFPDWDLPEINRVMTVLERAGLVRKLTPDEVVDMERERGARLPSEIWENLGIDGRISEDDIGRMIEEELARPQPELRQSIPAEPGLADDIIQMIDEIDGAPAPLRPAATPPQPAGAAPDEINRYVPNGVIADRFGRTIYKGIRVRAAADGLEGTVVAVQQEPAYARIKLDDGRVVVRAGRRLNRIDNPPAGGDGGGAPAVPPAPAPAAPAAPAAPPPPAAPAAPPADAEVDADAVLADLSRIRVRLPLRARRNLGAPERDRRNAGFAIDDARKAFEDGDMHTMLLKFQRATFLLRRAGEPDLANQVTKHSTALQKAHRQRHQVGEAPVNPNVPVTPGDYVEAVEPNAAPVERSGASPGVSEPRDVVENAANPNARQIDYKAWRERDAEIAAAARQRPAKKEIWDANGHQEQRDILEKIFGVGQEFSFGDSKYTLTYRGHSVYSSRNGDKTAAMSMGIMDGNEVVGEVTRNLYFDARTGEYSASNKLMRITNRQKRGGGFAASYNRWMENWYIANGFSEVHVEAAGGGGWTGGYVWAANGFNWDLREHGASARDQLSGGADFVKSLLRRAGRYNVTPAEQAQIDELMKRATAVRNYEQGATLPTPLELALIGWRPGKSSWLGKNLMSDQSWEGVKSLVPDDYAYRQNNAYTGLKAAEGRIKNKQNAVSAPDLARAVVDPANVKAMGGSDRLQRWSRQVGDALLNGDSLATLPPLVKRDLKTMVNKILADWRQSERAGWSYSGMDVDLDKLNAALDAENRLDFPTKSSLPPAGEALRDVTLGELQTASGRAANPDKLADFTVKQLGIGEGGVNYTYKVTHNPSGQVYFVKWDKIASQWQGQDPVHGANGERDPNKYLAAMGYNGIPGFERSRVEDPMIIMQRVGDSLDLVERPKNAAVARKRPYSPDEYVDYRDPIRLQMLDGLFGNGDRHDGNYQYAQRANDGKFYLIPVDNAFNAIARHGDNLRWDPMNGWSTPTDRITGAYSGAYSRYLGSLKSKLGTDRFNAVMAQLVQEAIAANNAARPNYATGSLGDYIDAQLQQLAGQIADGTFANAVRA